MDTMTTQIRDRNGIDDPKQRLLLYQPWRGLFSIVYVAISGIKPRDVVV